MRPVVLAFAMLALKLSQAQANEAAPTWVELRLSPPFVRASGAPSLCPMVSVPLAHHWYIGGGYELVQDYDVGVQTSDDTYSSPMMLSGLRAGTWYRGGARRHGITFAGGPIVTASHPTYSLARMPGALDAGTYVFDLGVDVSVGHVWERLRLELYALPAWSFGQISSTATSRNDSFDELNLRVGLALAWAL